MALENDTHIAQIQCAIVKAVRCPADAASDSHETAMMRATGLDARSLSHQLALGLIRVAVAVVVAPMAASTPKIINCCNSSSGTNNLVFREGIFHF